jgi:surfeit locus 1 family protein
LSQSLKYSFGRYQIRINIWLLIVFLLLQALLNELGYWQLERAQQKQQRIALMAAGEKTTVNRLADLTAEQIQSFQTVKVNLTADNQRILLLDNKINQKRPGYHVLSLVNERGSEKQVLVNRGWVFAGTDRELLPKVELAPNDWLVEARVYPLPNQTISTGSAAIENFSTREHPYLNYDVSRLPVLDLQVKQALEKQFNLNLENYILRLNAGSQAALETNWVWTNMPAEKHLAYAFQWFGLSLALLIISVIASIRKR